MQVLDELQLGSMQGCADLGYDSDFLCYPESEHLIVTVPEPFTGNFGPHKLLLSDEPRRKNSIAIPYISHIHYGPRAYAAELDRKALAERKHSRVAMVFSLNRNSELRPLLLEQCALHPGACVADPGGDPSRTLHEMLDHYHSSWFCLMPPGDTPTRRAFYDCVNLGDSIPVVFDSKLLEFLPFSELLNYESFVEYVDMAAIFEGKDVVEMLMGVSEEEIFSKLGALHQLRHILQYASAPQHLLIRFDQLNTLHEMDDAFTASFKAVVRNSCQRSLLPKNKCRA